MDKLIIYLICINILGAVLDGVTAARRRRTSHKALSVLLGIIAIAGGAPGMIIAFALCDRTASKTFVMFGIDKYRAVKGGYRIPIAVLLGMAFAGGSIGALLGMVVFRHKIRKNYFSVGVPLILVMQVVLLMCVVNLL